MYGLLSAGQARIISKNIVRVIIIFPTALSVYTTVQGSRYKHKACTPCAMHLDPLEIEIMNAKRLLILIWVLLVFSTGGPVTSDAGDQKFPQPRGAVNDYAGIIPADMAAAMENLAREILDKTGTSVVVATVKTVGDSEPDMYANDLYKAWGIGKKGEDKGVLIFLALQERKVRIETGYGVEGILPDGLTGSILDQYIVPLLKQGNYGTGLFNGMIAVGQVIARDAGVTIGEGYTLQRPAYARRGKKQGSGLFSLLFLLILMVLIFSRGGRGMLPLLLLMGMSGRDSGGGFGGGGFSGGFGGFGGGMSGGGGASRGF